MEKLGQLRRADEWDLIVVDTPPSRSALDFLDAPQRLSRFLDGKLLRLLTAPAKVGGRAYLRVLNAGFGVVTGVLTRILGTAVLKDVQTLVSALDTMFGGFRERADYTYQLLRAPGTSFLVVAAPEDDALREASYFVERLDTERMPLAGLVLNRVQQLPAARSQRVRQKIFVPRLQRQQFFIPAAVHLFVPARVGHFPRLPKLQSAPPASEKSVSPILFDSRGARRCTATRAGIRFRRLYESIMLRSCHSPRAHFPLQCHPFVSAFCG